ncbi:MAG: response regulator [Alphaproteobacteria bacterium]|nr:response regulator [Alphaproteobacteria bacterium]
MNILIVDDDKDSAMTLGWLVEMLGQDYKLAHSGQEALDVAPGYNPSLVLMDISLPGMTGYEACQKMRQNPALAHTIIAAQTGWGEEQHRQKSKEAGFDHHLVKPVSIASLQELLDTVRKSKA